MLRPGGKTVLRAVAGHITTLPLDGYDVRCIRLHHCDIFSRCTILAYVDIL
jgi:hypothetical protein